MTDNEASREMNDSPTEEQAAVKEEGDAQQQPPQTKEERKEAKPLSRLFRSLALDEDEPQRLEWARETLKEVLLKDKEGLNERYNILILYDEGTLVRSDADRIYGAVRGFSDKRDILLVLYSGGGQVGPGYLISQLCRESAKERFIVTVPRQAKSAATLICCGADEIHLGSVSELGPIDPQIGAYPALGLGNALKHIADLVNQFPSASSMFAEYLSRAVRPIDLGYYERVAESAAQYAEKLLSTHATSLPKAAHEIAHHLVYAYKDHGFVIDKQEALSIFGPETIKVDTEEYRLGNLIYDQLTLLRQGADIFDYDFWWIGSLDTGCVFLKRKRAQGEESTP